MEKPSERIDNTGEIFEKAQPQMPSEYTNLRGQVYEVANILDEQAEEIARLKERLEKVGEPTNKPFDYVISKWAKEVKTLYENRYLHKACENCHGTGRGEYGACVHATGCPCPKHSATC